MQAATEVQDPGQRVAPELLRHLHLVSQHVYPVIQTTSLDGIFEKLSEAPKIVREVASMSWTFLDAPANGTLMLVYQSPQTRNRFATDGYLWADQEQYYRQEHQGYVIEMLVHNYGFNPLRESQEGAASHARHRYRLVQNLRNPANQPNSNLWVLHYSKAPQPFPASRVQVSPEDSNLMMERRFLQSQGRLPDNRFMLEDHSNWPTITPPAPRPHPGAAGPPAGFRGMPPSRQPMPQHPHMAEHTPNKRQRTNASRARAPPMQVQQQQRQAQQAQEADPIELEENEYRDLHDILTERDISKMRYTQHHEWMEEVYSSYPTFAIKPVSLGLGRKGELEPLTDGFFDPPRPPTPPGHSGGLENVAYDTTMHRPLEAGKPEEFFARANRKIEELNKEMEEMKLEHAKRMESFARIRKLREVEKSLRDAVASGGEGVHNDAAKIDGWRTEIHDPAHGDATIAVLRQMDQIDNTARDVEKLTGKKIGKLEEVKMVQKGGLVEEIVSEDTRPRGGTGSNGAGAGDITSLFDDFLEPGAGERSMLGSAQPSTKPSASPQPVPDADQPMSGQGEGADDWVMVNKQDSQPQPTTPAGDASAPSAAAPAPVTASAPATSAPAAPQEADAASPQLDDEGLGDDLVDFGGDGANDDPGFEGGAFDDAIDFGDLGDTPGDHGMHDFGDSGRGDSVGVDLSVHAAGAGPGAGQIVDAGADQAQVQVPEIGEEGHDGDEQGDDDLGDDADAVDLMEDSAFGDAFHHTENEAQEG